MKNAVFFDIDGTILDKSGLIPQSTIEAITELRKNGTYAFLSSGRTRSFIRNQQLLGMGFDGILAGCGTYVEFKEQVLYQKLLDQSVLQQTVAILKANHMPLVLEGPEYLFLDKVDFEGDPFLDYLESEMGNDLLPILNNEQNWLCNKISVNVVKENMNQVLKTVEKDYEVLIHGGEFMELVPKGYTKASGIEYICNYLGIDREHTFALGDSRNDVEMLQYVKNGIAMGNGTTEAFEAADFITKPLLEDGVAHALQHFGLIS